MKEEFDVVIVGAGLLGCFTARNLMRYRLRVAILEQNPDVCMELSRANTAVVYTGYDTRPGTLKTELCLRANRSFGQLCEQLDVDFIRRGSLMTAEGPISEATLRKKLRQGMESGVSDLKLIVREEALSMEPSLSPAITLALFSPDTGTVNPWALGIAAAENAVENGACLYLNHAVTAIKKTEDRFHVTAGGREFRARAVINCAGLSVGAVSELIAAPYFRIRPTRGEYLVLDPRAAGLVHRIVFQEAEEKSKGITLVPTTDGSLLIGATESEPENEERSPSATTQEGLQWLREQASAYVPALPLSLVIRSFGTMRPNPFWLDVDRSGGARLSGRSINSFVIGQPDDVPGLINLIGIKTPGLTCSDEIGAYAAELALTHLGPTPRNPDFRPSVKKRVRFHTLPFSAQQALAANNPAYGRIVCRCNQITEAEVVEAIHRTVGATTVDGVKRRAGTCLGRCQGSFCTERILELLARELRVPPEQIRKDKPGSYLVN